MTSLGKAAAAHPKPKNVAYSYGTAGFRTKASVLDSVAFRVGLLAVLRSRAKQGDTIGVMITASHNPVGDNGVKIVDPMGEMLEGEWEEYASRLANASDETLLSVLQTLTKETRVNPATRAHVVYGRDTRPSGPALAKALEDGIVAAGGDAVDMGIVTTPQLHYFVRCINTNGEYGEATEAGYYKMLSAAFQRLMGERRVNSLICDGANGVGAEKMRALCDILRDRINCTVINDGSQGELNENCGADFVKVQQCGPSGLDLVAGERYCSLDGDADRLVYYFVNSAGQFCLLDGDKIAAIAGGYLKDLVKAAGVDLTMAIVQTAYANGASTRYLREVLDVPVPCVKTGVKHLHHEAVKYDIGIYFEANGHGTVVFSSNAVDTVHRQLGETAVDTQRRAALDQLDAMIGVINQAVGDAISDILMVEAILARRGWGLTTMGVNIHRSPQRQLKVSVRDRTVVQCNDDETRVLHPIALQKAIDGLSHRYRNGRAFVRPSGTEDVVRVYAEADTGESADALAYAVANAVYDVVGGVGTRLSNPNEPSTSSPTTQ